MQVDQTGLTLRLKLSASALHQHVSILPEKAGKELAMAVDKFSNEKNLGYYPAIDYFEQVESFDKGLVETIEQLSWQVSKFARQEIQKRLRPIFATVKFVSVQTEAYALPGVRPGQESALERLSEHYTPDTLKVELRLSMLRKESDQRKDAAEGYARKMMFRWLGDLFESIEVTSSRVV
jgi:hypothetical protein